MSRQSIDVAVVVIQHSTTPEAEDIRLEDMKHREQRYLLSLVQQACGSLAVAL